MPEPTKIDIDASRNSPSRMLGFGAPIAAGRRNGQEYGAREQILDMIQAKTKASTNCWEVLESVTITGQGPLTTASAKKLFGPTFNFVVANDIPEVAVTTTMNDFNRFQCNTLVFGTRLILEGAMYMGLQMGLDVATTETSALASPNAWFDRSAAAGTGDIATGGALGLIAGGANTAKRAFISYGGWQDEFFFALARAYDMDWRVGAKTKVEGRKLRHAAVTPSSAQSGSTGVANWDMYTIARPMNDYYQSTLNATRQFQPIDRRRTGALTVGGVGVSTMSPDRSNEVMSVIIGGGKTDGFLRKNSDVLRNKSPLLFPGGVSIGLQYRQADAFYVAEAQKWIDVAHATGQATTAAADLISSGKLTLGALNGGASGTTGIEATNDLVQVVNSLFLANDRTFWKAGGWSIVQDYFGVELTGDCLRCMRDGGLQEWLKCQGALHNDGVTMT